MYYTLNSLFGFSGRMGRRAFLACQLIIYGYFLVSLSVGTLLFFDFNRSGPWGVITGSFTIIAAIILCARAMAATLIKRLHDLGHSGLHAIWIGILYALLGRMEILSIKTGDPKFVNMTAGFGLISLSVMLYLICMPGEKSENQYGCSNSDANLA